MAMLSDDWRVMLLAPYLCAPWRIRGYSYLNRYPILYLIPGFTIYVCNQPIRTVSQDQLDFFTRYKQWKEKLPPLASSPWITHKTTRFHYITDSLCTKSILCWIGLTFIHKDVWRSNKICFTTNTFCEIPRRWAILIVGNNSNSFVLGSSRWSTFWLLTLKRHDK